MGYDHSLHTLNGGVQDSSYYEYYFHLLVNTPNLVTTHPVFAEAMGFVNDTGDPFFSLDEYLVKWETVGGSSNGSHPLFDPNCE